MTLRQFLSVLSSNAGTQVKLLTLDETELLTFNIEGYTSVESDILDRVVKKTSIIKNTTGVTLKVILYDIPEGTSEG